ncbi:MAG: PLP-dependent aminotransferase family protein [Actinomycetales bacterium]
MPRVARPVEFEVSLPPRSDLPLRHQVADALVEIIRAGRLRPGDPLPSSRALAEAAGVARAVVVDAYDELLAAGFVVARPGSGTFVAPGADRAARLGAASHVEPVPGDPRAPGFDADEGFEPAVAASGTAVVTGHCDSPDVGVTLGQVIPERAEPAVRFLCRAGRPDVGLINTREWRRAWASATASPPVLPSDPAGHDELRSALADHLRRTRGVAVHPDQVLILPGVAAGLVAVLEGSLAHTAARPTLVTEDPGYQDVTTTARHLGYRVRPLPVDSDGLCVDLLRGGDDGAYVTPAHQFPLGARMSVERRADLLGWAGRTGATIIEDDYDGEFRYGVAALPALRALPGADEHVSYLGTASKILTPGLRLAWLVPPDRLRGRIAMACRRHGLQVDGSAASMLARVIDSGDLARHLARAGREYAARFEALSRAFAHRLPQVRLVGVEAGLHLVLDLDEADEALSPDLAVCADPGGGADSLGGAAGSEGAVAGVGALPGAQASPGDLPTRSAGAAATVDDTELVDRLRRRGLATEPLSAYCADVTRTGVVLGYANLPVTSARDVVDLIASELLSAR